MGVVSFWIKTVNGPGVPDRFRGRLFDTVQEAIGVAAKHHKGDYQIMHHIDQKAALEPVKECPTCRRPM